MTGQGGRTPLLSASPPTHNKRVFAPSGLALPSSTTDQGPRICPGSPSLGAAMCPAGQGRSYATRACLKYKVWSMASLALEGRGNATVKILHNSRTDVSGRDRLRASLRPLPQKGNGCPEAADQKDNTMLPAVRCPKWREEKGNKEIIVDT